MDPDIIDNAKMLEEHILFANFVDDKRNINCLIVTG